MERSLCRTVTVHVLVAALLAGGTAAAALAQTTTDLALVSLEDLMNIEISSASRKEQRADAVPGAVYVISQDDIRRSGMTTVPELLRLVPGLQVAQINANKWAISSRGFNGLFSNKLLVLVDGRSIYDPLNSGQFLETEDLILEDIDRIEVVRGPAGAIWGADAVNGVVNIITKPAGDTQGASVRLSAGTLERVQGSVRYGGSIGSVLYRVFTQWSDHGDTLLADRQTPAGDSWSAFASGFRADWKANHDAVMFESNFSAARLDPLWVKFNLTAPPGAPLQTFGGSDSQVANLLGRWTRSWETGTVLQVQSFFDSRPRFDVATGQSLQKTSDLDVQYRTRLWSRHDVVVGAGSRTTREELGGGTNVFVTPAQSNRSVSNMFVQDEIALAGNRIHVTLGSKLEHDTYASWGVQPTARVMWDLPRRQHVWAYSGLQTNEPITPYLELVPGPPHVLVPTQYGDRLDADTQGIEFAGRWQPVHGWRLDGSYTGFRFTPHVDPVSRDLTAATADLQQLGVEAYSRVDARVEVKLTPHLTAMVVGQNLANPAHAEFAGAGLQVAPTLIPRSVRMQLTFRH